MAALVSFTRSITSWKTKHVKKQQIHTNTVPVYIWLYMYMAGRQDGGLQVAFWAKHQPNTHIIQSWITIIHYHPLPYRKAQHCFASCPGLALAHVDFRSRKWWAHPAEWFHIGLLGQSLNMSQDVARCLKFMPLGGAFTSKDLFGLSLLSIRLTLAALAQWAWTTNLPRAAQCTWP